MLRVGVAGAHGKLGLVACAAIEAADDLALAATLSRGGDLAAFVASGLDVVLDCSVHPATVAIAHAALDAGIPIVIGATGWSDDEVAALRARCDATGVPAMLVPNFSLGAVLMMRFAAVAAVIFPQAEIIEMHPPQKRDAPSGTAKLTAQRIAAAGGAQPPIHSVRLPGLVAHQEVIFGGVGETLAIRHDSLARESFARGMTASVRAIPAMRGLVVGMDALVDGLLGDA